MNKIVFRHTLIIIALFALFIGSYVTIVRPWEMRWGATDEELAMALPGDSAICGASGPSCHSGDVASVSTRAVTIHAPAATVWGWLIETGVERGGWFSHEWLENLFATGSQNTEEIKPELQSVKLGDHWLFTKLGNVATVTLLDPERTLSLNGWIFHLRPIDNHTTRLIVRYPMHSDELINAPLSFSIMDPAHFVMESGMMLGIKERAERYQ
jgi:hypothetical protein